MFLLPQQLWLFEGINDPSFDALLDHLPLRKFPKGVSLFEEGEISQEVFGILSGIVELVAKDQNFDLQQIEVIHPGRMIGETSFFTGWKNPFSALAIQDVVAVEINQAWLHSVSFSFPILDERLLKLFREGVLIDILRAQKWFAPFPKPKLLQIAEEMECIRFKENDLVILEEASEQGLMIIKRGKVLLFKEGEKKVPVGFLSPGDCFEVSEWVRKEGFLVSGIAEGLVEVMILPPERLQKFS